MLEICELVESAISYFKQMEEWDNDNERAQNLKENMQGIIKNKANAMYKNMQFCEWERVAKQIWGKKWFSTLCRLNLTSKQIYAEILNELEKQKKALVKAQYEERINELVEIFKKDQSRIKDLIQCGNLPKYLYSFELTCIAVNTLYQLGVMSNKECKDYIIDYANKHPSLKNEKAVETLVKYLPRDITYKEVHSDGCHSTYYDGTIKFLWNKGN